MKGIGDIAILIFVLIGPLHLTTHAQSGELENVEIEIIKERKISLPEAERKFAKIAPQASEPISPPITYSFKPLEVQLPLANLAVRPLKLKREADGEDYRGQVSAGYGNYASPYLEGYFTSKRNARQLMGAHALLDIWAKGPIDKRNSGSGKYGVSVFANSFGEKVKAGSYLSFDQSFWHFYGYPTGPTPEAADILQRFNQFSLGGTIASASVQKFTYKLAGDFSYLTDKADAKESKVDFDFNSSFAIEQDRSLQIAAAYQLVSRQDVFVEAKPRSLFKLSALYSFSPIEKLHMEAGFNVAYENDTIDKDFHFYPTAFARYDLSKKVRANASLSGDVTSVSMHSLQEENPWLAPNITIAHTNEAFLLRASVEAMLIKNTTIEIGGSVASLRNLYFYSNLPSDASKFELLYDKSATERVNFFGSLNYALARSTHVVLRADWYSYSTKDQEEAWHRPTFKIALNAAHNFYNKLKVSSSFISLGGMKAYDVATDEAITLKTVLELSLRADYYVSTKFLVFLQGANLLSNEYNLYLGYPVRGVQVRAGFSWSF